MTCLTLILLFRTFFTAATQKDIIILEVPEIMMSAGDSSLIRIQVQVKEGFHIQGNVLKDQALIPTTLTIRETTGLLTGSPVFPPVKKFRLEGSAQPLDVFDGTFEIGVPLRTERLTKGLYRLEARLHYQACDARTCFFPRTKTLFIPVKITG